MSAFLLSISFIAGAVALFPSYVDVTSSLSTVEEELEKKKEEAEKNKELIDETVKGAYVINVLGKDYKSEKLTDYIKEISNKRPEGISIVGFSYNRDLNQLTLEGIAETRDMVAPFARTLETCEFFESVPVPIADLAGKENLEFRLNIAFEENVKI